MVKTKTRSRFRCRACGAVAARWQGRCDGCGEWDTLDEEAALPAPVRRRPALGNGSGPVPLPEVETTSFARLATGIGELDRVLGGGIVAGSAVLVAGDPGIGKSTLLLQASGGLAERGARVLYVSGEESPGQTRLRADRLGIASPRVLVLAETDVAAVLRHAEAARPDLVVLDSIQTAHSAEVASPPGSVAQVRECAAALTAFAKATGVPVVLIGHVTKSGDIAGPRVLAHVVDAVVSFEGDRYHAYRVLRAVKNRFGTTDEIGIFEMRPGGLAEVRSPAGLLLESGAGAGPGSVVVPVVEGSRILLVEIQALTALAHEPPGRRRTTGLDARRLHLLLAVLQKKLGASLSGVDVFVNAVGGIRVEEPGTDLGVALAVVSSLFDTAFPERAVAFGEIGLMGEIRPVPRARARLAEAAKLGFGHALVPPGTDVPPGIRAVEVDRITDARDWMR